MVKEHKQKPWKGNPQKREGGEAEKEEEQEQEEGAKAGCHLQNICQGLVRHKKGAK